MDIDEGSTPDRVVARRESEALEINCTSDQNTNQAEEEMIDYLIQNDSICFKSQQIGETELTTDEKKDVARNILKNNKSTFLTRFGKYLKTSHLEYFKNYITSDEIGYEIDFLLKELDRYHSLTARKTDIKNRRYEALKKMVNEGSYFTETEMMKRNPLLYEHLVGQYLTEDQRKERDNIDTQNITFVNLLLEGIERDHTRELKQKQKNYEEEVMMEEDESDEDNSDVDSDDASHYVPSTSKWGEWESKEDRDLDELELQRRKADVVCRDANWQSVGVREKNLLKQEFISHMYQNFLDGKDTDFDYSQVDFNNEYDCIDLREKDEEEKYFDSESPEEIKEENKNERIDDSSEDELDIFMQKLNQHPTIQQLSTELQNI